MAGKNREEPVTLPTKMKSEQEEKEEVVIAPKKQKSQIFFGVGVVFLLSIVVPYMYEAYRINVYAHQNKPEGFFFPSFLDVMQKVVASAFGNHLYQRFCHFVGRPLFKNYVKEQHDEELREKFIIKACNAFQSATYFIFTTIYGWYVLKDTPYLPWYLGGVADGCFTKIPIHTIFVPVDMSLYHYSFATWGYHLNSLVSHLFFEPKTNDFEEMLVHHIATNSLYVGYIFGNQMPIGCLISFIHDIADVPGFFVKGIFCTEHNNIAAAFFIVTIALWFHTRLVVFPQIIYYIYNDHVFPEEFAWCQWYVTLNAVFLSSLAVLHVYWFGIFFQVLHHFVFKGEAKDFQHQVRKDSTSPTSGAETKTQKND